MEAVEAVGVGAGGHRGDLGVKEEEVRAMDGRVHEWEEDTNLVRDEARLCRVLGAAVRDEDLHYELQDE